MPGSLETRRLGVIEALRALAREPRPVPVPAPPPVPPAPAVHVEPVLDAVVDAVEERLDAVSAKISEVLRRLDSVETTLLEAAWERPVTADRSEPAPEDAGDDERVSVPKVPFGEGKMSSVAADALFGRRL